MIFGKEPSVSVALQIVSQRVRNIPREMLLDGVPGSLQRVALEVVKGYYQFTGDPPYATKPFKVDTGAAITAIKKSDWDHAARRAQIRWLHEPGVVPRPDRLPGKSHRGTPG